MSAFVLDCSVTMIWCFEDEIDPACDALLDRLRRDEALVPALWHWEVANVLAMAVRKGRVVAAEVVSRLALLTSLPIRTDSEGFSRAWRETMALAEAHGLTVYDAAYLELALRSGVPLATRDKALRDAAIALGVTAEP